MKYKKTQYVSKIKIKIKLQHATEKQQTQSKTTNEIHAENIITKNTIRQNNQKRYYKKTLLETKLNNTIQTYRMRQNTDRMQTKKPGYEINQSL